MNGEQREFYYAGPARSGASGAGTAVVVAAGIGVAAVIAYLVWKGQPDYVVVTPPISGGGGGTGGTGGTGGGTGGTGGGGTGGGGAPKPTSGSIKGRITRAGDGLPMAGVAVNIGSKSTTTDADGYYAFEGLPFGKYTAKYSKTCYAPFSQYIELTADAPDYPGFFNISQIASETFTYGLVPSKSAGGWYQGLCDGIKGMRVQQINSILTMNAWGSYGFPYGYKSYWVAGEIWIRRADGTTERIYRTRDYKEVAGGGELIVQDTKLINTLESGAPLSSVDIVGIFVKRDLDGAIRDATLQVQYVTV